MSKETKGSEVEYGRVFKSDVITSYTHFKGEVYFLTREEGGRHAPVLSGYCAQFYFRTTDVTGVVMLPEGRREVMPGNSVTLEVMLIAPVVMEKGARFAIRESSRTVGAGTVTEVLLGEIFRHPFADVDEPMNASEAAEELSRAEMEIQEHREAILKDCVGVDQVTQLTGQSPEAIEQLRRTGSLLALRLGNQWRYPRWQFEPDAPGGVLPGLGETLQILDLSPAGAAFWFLQPYERLGGAAPVELLRRRRPEPVLQLAREHSYMP